MIARPDFARDKLIWIREIVAAQMCDLFVWGSRGGISGI